MINEKITTIRETTDKSWQEIADDINREFDTDFSMDAVRFRYNRHKVKQEEETPNYKEQHEILAGGVHKSDKLIRLTEEQKKDVKYILSTHGFDPDEWELVTARHNIWNTNDKINGVQTLYASKITVKPRHSTFNFEKLLKAIKEVPSVTIEPKYVRDKQYLLLPLFDMHFGISDYDHYKESQSKIVEQLIKGYEEVLIILGQDLFQTDDFRGRTSSGREIGKVDVVKAWEDARLFFYPIIEYALMHSKRVKVTFSKGNHSETLEWSFIQMLKERFKQVEFDDRFKERKACLLGLNFVGFNHSDKKKEQNLAENFATEFPIEWSRAKTRTVFTGHLHHERVIDKGGILIRRMPTRNKIDEYHDDYGYTTAHKRFQIHEFSEEEQRASYYV